MTSPMFSMLSEVERAVLTLSQDKSQMIQSARRVAIMLGCTEIEVRRAILRLGQLRLLTPIYPQGLN